MANNLTSNTSQTITGLGTWTLNPTPAGFSFLRYDFTEVPPSSLIVTINDNGSPIYTSTATTTAQSAMQTKVPMNIAAGHTVTIVLSSAAPIDNQLNTVKTTITVGDGA